MSDTPVECPMCGGPDLRCVGGIADGDYFAGRVLPRPIPGGRLWHCESCGSAFKHPLLTAHAYASLYTAGLAEQWAGARKRRDFELAAAIIGAEPAQASVLDVGCGTAELLRGLPASHPRYGIEPGAEAVAVAQSHGIRILGADLAALPAEARFDVVMLIDVIEHAADVAALLRDALRHVAPGGLLLVSTGDPSSTAWRCWFGARFWYASFPEHLRFPSAAFFRQWAARQGARLDACIRFRYHALPWYQRLIGAGVQSAYALSPALFSAAGRVLRGGQAPRAARRQHYSPGVPGVFQDHQLLVVRKSAQGRENRKSA